MADGVLTTSLKQVIARINTVAGNEKYARVFDGTFRSDLGVDIEIGGAEETDQALEPLTGYRTDFFLVLRTAARSNKVQAVYAALNAHEEFAIQPMVNWVPDIANNLHLLNTQQAIITTGTQTVVAIETTVSINFQLEGLI